MDPSFPPSPTTAPALSEGSGAQISSLLVPDGTFVRIHQEDHPLPLACEVAVNFQDYHRSSAKMGRFGKIVGVDEQASEYLIMLDNFECVGSPMRRVEWRKLGT